MVKTVIKKVCMFVLVAGIVAPISAMDSSDESSWFSWSNAAVVFAGVGLGYWAYSSWNTEPIGRKKLTTSVQKVQTTATYQPQHEKHIPLTDEEVNPLFLSKEVVEFGKLSLVDQKRALGSLIDAYLEIPIVNYEDYTREGVEIPDEELSASTHHAIDTQVEAEDLITQYIQIIDLRTKSNDLDIAVHKMFSAKSKEARQVEALKIKALLGL